MSSVFLRLLNISITAGWIVLVVVLLRFVLKKAPKWIRVALWGLVALRLLLPVSIESALSLVPSAETVKIESVTAPVLTSVSDSTGVSYFYEDVQGERIVLQSGFSALNSVVNPSAETAAKQFDTVVILKSVAGCVWLFGAVAMLLYALISYLRLRHRVRASVKIEKGVYVCDEIRDPFILGLIVPKIYLPSGMDETTRAYVLAHERAHLRRFDHIWKPLGFLLLAVYWFNPLLWLAYILLCRDIELACDEKVVKEYDAEAKAAYSEALVKSSVSRRSIAACPLAFGETGVKSRVKSILNYKKPAFWIILVALLAGIVTAVCFLTVPKVTDPVPVPADEVMQWLDYYVISTPMWWEETKEIAIDAFPNVTFRWTSGSVEAVENGRARTLFTGMPIWNVYFSDVTGDGKPELCASVYFGSGMIDEHVVMYDYANRQSYTLWDRGTFDYHLYTDNGTLLVGKRLCNSYSSDTSILDTGTLMMHDGVLCCRWSDGSFTPLNRELHESELYGEWFVEAETDNDGNVLYAFDVGSTWKEYNFREDGTVTYNETVPVSSDYEKAFGHPVTYPYEVHDDYVYIAGDDTSGAFRFGQSDRDTRTLTLMYNTDAGTVYAKLRRMGTEGPQTIEEILLGTYVCTGAEQNGVSIPIPAEYAGMTIDLGDTSEGDTYKHTSTVTIGGEIMDGHGWTLDEDDMLIVWDQKTGKSMRFEWFPKQTTCTVLKLTIDQANPITLIFTFEDDVPLPASNAALPEETEADTLTQEQADAFVNGLSVEFEDGSPYGCDLVVFIDGFGTCLNVGDADAWKTASLRFVPGDYIATDAIYPHVGYAKLLAVGDREYYLGSMRVFLSDGQLGYHSHIWDNEYPSADASIFVYAEPSMMERNREVAERACVIKAFDAENRTVTVSYVSFDNPEDGYAADILYDTVEDETFTFSITDDTMLTLIDYYTALVKPDRFFRYLVKNRDYLNGVDDGAGDDRGIGFWIGLDGDTLLYLCEVYEE